MTGSEREALYLSLRVAIAATATILPLALALAFLLARRRFPGRALVDALVHLPLVLPPVVVGYGLLLLLGRRGLIGGPLGLDVAFTWWAAAIASGVMAFPLAVRTIRLAIELVDARLEDAARTLGASPLRVFRTVTLPLAMPGVLGGALLAFARSLGEFGATIAFAGNVPGETRTIPLAIYTYMQTPGGEPPALRLALASVVVSFVALLISEIWARRLRGRSAVS